MIPAKRGEGRKFDGIYNSLRDNSLKLEEAGLIERIIFKNDHFYRLTPLGHVYFRFVILLRESVIHTLNPEDRRQQALIHILQNFDEITTTIQKALRNI
jgi:hypothetical protein